MDVPARLRSESLLRTCLTLSVLVSRLQIWKRRRILCKPDVVEVFEPKVSSDHGPRRFFSWPAAKNSMASHTSRGTSYRCHLALFGIHFEQHFVPDYTVCMRRNMSPAKHCFSTANKKARWSRRGALRLALLHLRQRCHCLAARRVGRDARFIATGAVAQSTIDATQALASSPYPATCGILYLDGCHGRFCAAGRPCTTNQILLFCNHLKGVSAHKATLP